MSGFSGSSRSSSIYPVFLIVLLVSSSPTLSTVTSKLTLASPGAISITSPSAPWATSLAGTLTSIPFARSSAVLLVSSCPFTLMLPSTNVVPSGITSFTVTFPAKSPLFSNLIVYVIFSPSTT